MLASGSKTYSYWQFAELTSCANLLSCGGNTDDDTLTPTLVASLKSASHNVNVTSAVECVIATTVGHLDKLLLDGLTVLELLGVHKVGSTELLCPLLLAVVDIHDDNLAGTVLDATLNDGKTDTTSTEDGDVAALLNTTLAGRDNGGSVTGGDTTAEQAGTVHRGLLCDCNDGNVGYNGVLGEGRGTHKVEKILALALEARSAVGHDTLTLGSANLATEVGLAGLAELALFAFWGAAEG